MSTEAEALEAASAPVDAARPPAAARGDCLHCHPPATPHGVLRDRRALLAVLATLFVALAVAARVDGGSLLLTWDEPIQRAVESNRGAAADTLFLRLSFLGSTKVVLVLGAVLTVLAWRRCRAVGLAVLVATLGRPLLEFSLKVLVDRDRPDLERLVAGNGPSFPSGHVMAAVALWGMLPLVVALYTRDRRVWWTSTAISLVLIVGIGASRTYLGVHWFSDVTAGLVVGVFFLLAAQWFFERCHRTAGCRRRCEGADPSGTCAGDADHPAAGAGVLLDRHVDEPAGAEPLGEGIGLLRRPAVAGDAGRPG
jgi:undecaprenyl-diphosphatase